MIYKLYSITDYMVSAWLLLIGTNLVYLQLSCEYSGSVMFTRFIQLHKLYLNILGHFVIIHQIK